MAEQQQAAKVLRALKQTLPLPTWTKKKHNPFETLVVTIISQNTGDANTARAFETFSKRFEISPEALAAVSLNRIETAIRVAGLYKSKARSIKQAATRVIQKFGGTLEPILSMPTEEARKTLMQFPGVGPKTADVVLLFCAGKRTIPVDTHVNRVSKRLGFAPEKGEYEVVRRSLQALFDSADFLAVHLLFVAHGRKVCKSSHPLCSQCAVCGYCPSCGKWSKP